MVNFVRNVLRPRPRVFKVGGVQNVGKELCFSNNGVVNVNNIWEHMVTIRLRFNC
jgi:hypothetical protein